MIAGHGHTAWTTALAAPHAVSRLYRNGEGLMACGVTARQLAERIAQAHGVTLAKLQSPCARRSTVAARNEAVRAMAATGRYSFAEIGRFFGRDHTTVCFILGRTKKLPSDLRRAA